MCPRHNAVGSRNIYRSGDTGSRCVKIIISIVIYGFLSCKKLNNVWTGMTNCLCTHLSVILVFVSLVASLLITALEINTKITLP